MAIIFNSLVSRYATAAIFFDDLLPTVAAVVEVVDVGEVVLKLPATLLILFSMTRNATLAFFSTLARSRTCVTLPRRGAEAAAPAVPAADRGKASKLSC